MSEKEFHKGRTHRFAPTLGVVGSPFLFALLKESEIIFLNIYTRIDV
ncbi:hypothetical protein BGP_2967 [Beggiatoa sp. PS]|nr:hypothetical protein BGP_2967 [Beggiatoa sp. PS]